jgi:hypothetical protein
MTQPHLIKWLRRDWAIAIHERVVANTKLGGSRYELCVNQQFCYLRARWKTESLSQNPSSLIFHQVRSVNAVAPFQPVNGRLPPSQNLRQHQSISGFNEFVGINERNPVSAKFIDRHSQQQQHILVLPISNCWLAQNDKVAIDTLQLMQDLVGIIARPIVKDDKLVKMLNVMADKRFDNIQPTVYARNDRQFHSNLGPISRRP